MIIELDKTDEPYTHALYIYIQKYMDTPSNLLDLAIQATPIADRCIKLSTQPRNLHSQTLALK